MDAAPPTPGLAAAKEQMVALAEQAGKVQQQCGLDIVPAEFARGVLKWGLMQVSWDMQSAEAVLTKGVLRQAAAHWGCGGLTARLCHHIHPIHQTCMVLWSCQQQGSSIQDRLLHCRLCTSGPAARPLRRYAT